MRLFLILSFVLLLLKCSPEVASITETETGEISGQVVAKTTSTYIEGVEVTLHGSIIQKQPTSLTKQSSTPLPQFFTQKTTTNRFGFFKFKNIPVDKYYIEVSNSDSTGALIETEITKTHMKDTLPVIRLESLISLKGKIPDSLTISNTVFAYLNKIDRFVIVNTNGYFDFENIPLSDYKITFIRNNQVINTIFDSVKTIPKIDTIPKVQTNIDDFTLAYFGFDENSGDSLFDMAGKHKGILKGATRTSGYNGKGIECTYNKFAQFDSIIQDGMANGTVDFYFKLNNTFNNDSTYSFLGNRGARVHIIYSKGSIYFQKNHDNIHKYVNYNTNLQSEKWYHLAVSWGSKGMRIFIDNNLVASNNDTSNYMEDTTDSTRLPFYIGYKMWGGMEAIGITGTADYYFDGVIDELHISTIERY